MGTEGISEKSDKDTEKKYRRIVGGLAWPSTKPGFIVIVGEDDKKDPILRTYCLRTLGEAEDTDIEGLLGKYIELRERHKVRDFFGDLENKSMVEFLRQFNEGLSQKEIPTVWLQKAPFVDDPKRFEFYIHTIRKHLNADKKTLQFGENSKLSGYLMGLTSEEIKTADVSDYPPIAALGYALSYLDIYQPSHSGLQRVDTRKLARSYSIPQLGK